MHHGPLGSVIVLNQRLYLRMVTIGTTDRKNIVHGKGPHTLKNAAVQELRAGHDRPSLSVKVLNYRSDMVRAFRAPYRPDVGRRYHSDSVHRGLSAWKRQRNDVPNMTVEIEREEIADRPDVSFGIGREGQQEFVSAGIGSKHLFPD